MPFIEKPAKKQRKIYNFFKAAGRPASQQPEVKKENGEKTTTTSTDGEVVTETAVKPKTKLPTSVSKLLCNFSEENWHMEMSAEFNKPYFKEIGEFLDKEYSSGKVIFPPLTLIFNAFNLTPLPDVKVVILGQDPYHGNGQAHGLSFSVPEGVEPPPSLKNIFTELTNDIPGFQRPAHGCLTAWAKQGVLLLNATLTVQAHLANSHAGIGWQRFTDAAIKVVNDNCSGVVFLLWGGFAHKKEKLVNPKKHCIIKTAHPSPLSATKFFGCRCFSRANEALRKFGKSPIEWRL